MLVYSVEVGFCITAILILPGDLRTENTVRSERTTLLLKFIGPIDAAGLHSFVDGVHHVLVCFQGFIVFTCRKKCLTSFLVCSETQGLEVPAEEHGQVLVYLMNVFR
jgi:hypothetical protein